MREITKNSQLVLSMDPLVESVLGNIIVFWRREVEKTELLLAAHETELNSQMRAEHMPQLNGILIAESLIHAQGEPVFAFELIEFLVNEKSYVADHFATYWFAIEGIISLL